LKKYSVEEAEYFFKRTCKATKIHNRYFQSLTEVFREAIQEMLKAEMDKHFKSPTL
jgi:F0F1-type ATP synthase membrane subunit a